MVPPSDKIIDTDCVQTYDKIPALVRPRHPLANWTSVRIGDNLNRPTDQEISEGQLQWNTINDSNRQGQRHNRTSDETESAHGEPIYSDDASENGIEELEWIYIYKVIYKML